MDTNLRLLPPRQSVWRVIAAFAIAPMVPILLVFGVPELYAAHPNVWDPKFRLWLLIATFVAYATTLVIGVPLFLLLPRKVVASLVNCVLAGACVAATTWLMLGLIPTPNSSSYSGGHDTIVGGHYTVWGWIDFGTLILEIAALGALGGLAFWLIAAAGNLRQTAGTGINP
jgi:hypothetical protein